MGLIICGVFIYILNVIIILVEEDNFFFVDSFYVVLFWYLLFNFLNCFYIFLNIKLVGKYVIYVVGFFINYYFFCFYVRCIFCKFDLFIY